MKNIRFFVFLMFFIIVISYSVYRVPRKSNQYLASSVVIPAITGLSHLPDDPPVPEPGKASISGVLYTLTGKGPIPGTVFYLVPVTREGSTYLPLVLTGPRAEDPQGHSDDQGKIILNNIPPGSYYLTVWAPYSWIFAVQSDVDKSFLVLNLKPNQRLNLGIIYVPWP